MVTHPFASLLVKNKSNMSSKCERTSKQAYNKHEGQWMMISLMTSLLEGRLWKALNFSGRECELKLKAWKRSRMKLNWNVPYRGLGFDGNGTIESVYSQSSQYYVISAVGLNNYQYAREPWCYLQAYPLVSKFRITCKSKKVKFRGKFILNFKKKKSFQI